MRLRRKPPTITGTNRAYGGAATSCRSPQRCNCCVARSECSPCSSQSSGIGHHDIKSRPGRSSHRDGISRNPNGDRNRAMPYATTIPSRSLAPALRYAKPSAHAALTTKTSANIQRSPTCCIPAGTSVSNPSHAQPDRPVTAPTTAPPPPAISPAAPSAAASTGPRRRVRSARPPPLPTKSRNSRSPKSSKQFCCDASVQKAGSPCQIGSKLSRSEMSPTNRNYRAIIQYGAQIGVFARTPSSQTSVPASRRTDLLQHNKHERVPS